VRRSCTCAKKTSAAVMWHDTQSCGMAAAARRVESGPRRRWGMMDDVSRSFLSDCGAANRDKQLSGELCRQAHRLVRRARRARSLGRALGRRAHETRASTAASAV
jgi:hypothetical protein